MLTTSGLHGFVNVTYRHVLRIPISAASSAQPRRQDRMPAFVIRSIILHDIARSHPYPALHPGRDLRAVQNGPCPEPGPRPGHPLHGRTEAHRREAWHSESAPVRGRSMRPGHRGIPPPICIQTVTSAASATAAAFITSREVPPSVA